MFIEELLKDSDFITELLIGPCVPSDEEVKAAPVNREWIRDDLSDYVTNVFQKLMPDEVPYISRVLVERNPDTLHDGAVVDENGKRMRYIIVTVIPDTDFPFNYSYPLINLMWTVSLTCWETIRATISASRKYFRIFLADHPEPPILNNARVNWVSLYLGRMPYEGISRLSEQWASAESWADVDRDVHLFEVRNMEPHPALQRLIEAYDLDHPGAPKEDEDGNGSV